MDIEESWKTTCRLVLGKELKGSVNDYGDWLSKGLRIPGMQKSIISGKPTRVYVEELQVIDNSELEFQKSAEVTELNEIKDVQSLLNAVSPVLMYTGNIMRGNCMNVQNNLICNSINTVENSYTVYQCKYVAYCSTVRFSEHMFGSGLCEPHCKMCIRAHNSIKVSNVFEVDWCQNSHDLMFCHNCRNVSHGLFCFNVSNKTYVVGNKEVGPEKFKKIKKMLQTEIIRQLEQNKKFDYSIYNFFE